MITVNPLILQHVVTHLPLLLNRDFLLDIFTMTEKTKAVLHDDGQATPIGECYLYTGKLLDIDGQLYTATNLPALSLNTGHPINVVAIGMPVIAQLAAHNSPITLNPGAIVNYTGDPPLATSMGRLLLNYTILVDPFGSLISYINDLWKIEKIEIDYIFEFLRTETISVAQIKHYSRNLHFICHFTELSVPSFSQRSLTIDPAIIKRRDELLTEHRAEIEAGNLSVMNSIETELIAMDRASLAGDESTPFYDMSVGKSYGVHRKTMYLLGGMVPEFGGKGYEFVENSLEEGWNVADFPTLCNDIRRGSYNRAKETAKGGEETKFLIRIFQNTAVTEDDCRSTSYLPVNLTKELAPKFLYQNILVDGKLVTLTADNIAEYIGTRVLKRSPMYCHTKPNYCYTCMGELFRTINQEVLTMVAVNVTSSFTLAALKSMHGVAAKTLHITSLDKFVI